MVPTYLHVSLCLLTMHLPPHSHASAPAADTHTRTAPFVAVSLCAVVVRVVASIGVGWFGSDGGGWSF